MTVHAVGAALMNRSCFLVATVFTVAGLTLVPELVRDGGLTLARVAAVAYLGRPHDDRQRAESEEPPSHCTHLC